MSFVKSVAITAGVTVATLVVAYAYFHASMPDCRVGQSDGQYGLATFLVWLYSLAAAGVAMLVSALYFVLRQVAERRQETLEGAAGAAGRESDESGSAGRASGQQG
jgi:hypothetical protein